MLAVNETALPGIGLSIPSVTVRTAAPYLAIAVSGDMRELPQFGPGTLGELHQYLGANGIAAGHGLFRYKRFDERGGVELDVAALVTQSAKGGGAVIASELPAGRYATATYTGPHDRLYDAFSMLTGWLAARGLTSAGEPGAPTCQAEIYRISPAEVNDPMQWQTDLLILLAE
jgi:effector-binding domain-containing protein